MRANRLNIAAVGTLWRTFSGSLALVTGRVSSAALEARIRDTYSEPAELETARRHASGGLTGSECALFRRHLVPAARVLDVGCASGRVSRVLRRAGCRVVGVDRNGAMVGQAIDLAAGAALTVPFLVMDARALAFRSESFDAVLLVGSVIGYIRGRAHRRATLRDARRVLRPGGTILIVTPSRESAWRFKASSAAMRAAHRVLSVLGRAANDWEPGDRVGPAWSGDGERLVYWYMYAPSELESDLVAAGFEIVESDPDAYMMTFVGRKPSRDLA
jgi:SAM-dependent methyltransferase